MTDCFLATVISFNSATYEGQIQPLIVENDGTDHPIVKAKSVGGLAPLPGDKVIVVTSRNNLDDQSISRYYEASESNCRIIEIASTGGIYNFKGNYKFEGNVIIDGDLTTTGDITSAGNLNLAGDALIGGDATLAGNLTVIGTAQFGAIPFATHKHISAAPGVATGPPIP